MNQLAFEVGQTATPEAVQFYILAPIAVLAALGIFGQEGSPCCSFDGLDHDYAGDLLHSKWRSIPWCSSSGGLHRRSDDALPLHSDVGRR